MKTQYMKQFYLTCFYDDEQDRQIYKDKTQIVDPFTESYFLTGINNSSNILITHFELQAPPETKFKIFYLKDEINIETSIGEINSLGFLDWDLESYGFIKKIQLLSVPSLKNAATITNFNSTVLLTLWYQYK